MGTSSKQTTKEHLVPCVHCGTPTLFVPAPQRAFCCNGCMGAYSLIHEMGLEDYYKLRSDTGDGQCVIETEHRNTVLMDLDAAGVRVNHLPGGLDCVRLSVEGMHCAACSWLIERMQPTIHGLLSTRVRLSDNSVELIYDPNHTTAARIAGRLSKIGYQLSPFQEDSEEASEVVLKQREHWVGLALAAFLAANAMWIGIALYAGESTGISRDNEYFLRWVGALLGLLSAAIPGRIFFQTAWHALKTKSPHVDIPVAISLLIGSVSAFVGAWSGSGHVYFDSLASFVLLLRIGRYLQFRAQSKARLSITRLLRWNTNIAKRCEPNGDIQSVPASRLARGDLVQVEPGEIIPGDGVVTTGRSAVDMSLLTGESQPILVEPLSRVVGGTTNLTSTIKVRIDASGDESRIGKLMAMVRDATTYRTPWIDAADRVGKWFVIVVLALACGTMIGWTIHSGFGVAIGHTMALLTIACPCALALAAPLVITIALGRAAKRQIWIREGACLEKLSEPGMLWVDKTGTLTLGRAHVHNWFGDECWLPAIGAIERGVHHPIASAIVAYSSPYEESEEPLVATNVIQEQGFGVRGLAGGVIVTIGNERWIRRQHITVLSEHLDRAQGISERGQTAIWVAIDDNVVGFFAIGDALRQDAIQTLGSLQGMGWKLGILSGDHQSVVDQIAYAIRVEGIELHAVLGCKSPEEKLQVITESRKVLGMHVAMVGDGVNDAAALAAADIGIAIRGNGEQSLAAAPIYIANPRFGSLLELFSASKRVVASIRNCFVVSLLYNTITISLAVAGWIHPLTAALFMPLSGISVLAMAIQSKTFSAKQSSNRPNIRLSSQRASAKGVKV